jgi:hypothetical protein
VTDGLGEVAAAKGLVAAPLGRLDRRRRLAALALAARHASPRVPRRRHSRARLRRRRRGGCNALALRAQALAAAARVARSSRCVGGCGGVGGCSGRTLGGRWLGHDARRVHGDEAAHGLQQLAPLEEARGVDACARRDRAHGSMHVALHPIFRQMGARPASSQRLSPPPSDG